MQPMQQNYGGVAQGGYQGGEGGGGGMMMGPGGGGQMMGGGGQMGGGQMGGGGGGQMGGPPQQSMASAAQPPSGDQNFDYMFKLLIIGNSSVGKTSFLFRYSDNSFAASFVSTVGIDFKVKTVQQQGKNIKLQIWDTAGQERYRTITTAYYRGAMGFILMYDITNEDSFNAVYDWCTQIKTYSWDNAQVILVGNKSDMEHERVVSAERGKRLADQLGLEFFESSAKDNVNVAIVFDRLVFLICDRMAKSLDAAGSTAPTGMQPTVLGGSSGLPGATKKLTDMANPAQIASQCQKC